MYDPIPTALGQKIMSTPAAKPYLAYREGVGEALAENILRDKKQQTAEMHESNLESADVTRDSVRTSTKKMVQDLAHDKSERQIHDTFVSLDAASGLPMADQNIYLDNLIEEYDGHGRLGTVLKYMRQTPDPKARTKLFGELNDVGVKGGYLDELYADKIGTGRSSDLQTHLAYVAQNYRDNNNGQEPPASHMVKAAEYFKKVSGDQAHDRALGTETGKNVAQTTPVAKEVRNIEVEHEGNVAESKKTGDMQGQINKIAELNDASGIETPMQKKLNGQTRLATATNEMIENYLKLDKMGGIINVNKSADHNIGVRALTSKIAQGTAGAAGSEVQSIRQTIQNIKPSLVQGIRAATGMGVRGMDTDKELQFYLSALGDETKDLQSNISALVLLDRLYGTGEVASKYGNIKPSANLEKEKEEYMKVFDEKRQRLIDETPQDEIDQYYNMQPSEEYTQDELDQYFIDLHGFLPEAR